MVLVTYIDANFGRILDGLRKSGLGGLVKEIFQRTDQSKRRSISDFINEDRIIVFQEPHGCEICLPGNRGSIS